MADKNIQAGTDPAIKNQPTSTPSDTGHVPLKGVPLTPLPIPQRFDLKNIASQRISPKENQLEESTELAQEEQKSSEVSEVPEINEAAESNEAAQENVPENNSTDTVPSTLKKPPKTQEQLDYEAAMKDHFKTKYWQPVFRPIVVLVSICIVTSLLLSLTNSVTQPIIAQNLATAAEQSRLLLLPNAEGFEAVDTAGAENVTAIYSTTNNVGWIIEASAQGYAGKVPVMVAFDDGGTILGVSFPENSETVGLGQKVREPEFAQQFANLSAENLTLGDIDKIASATISSSAAVNAVNAAINAYHMQTGSSSGVIPTELSDVGAYLLPGEMLVPITIDASDVQSTAYHSDKGNYIIYGQAQSSASLVTAAVAMDAEGTILNLWIDTSGESEQYGQTLASNRDFLDSFVGLDYPADVDAVADITNSSATVMQAVNSALAALSSAKEAS